MKRIISVFLAISIMISLLYTSPVYADSVDSAIQSRIDELYNRIGNKYFTTDGTACNNGNSCSSTHDHCRNSKVVQSEYFKSIFGFNLSSSSLFPPSPRCTAEANSCSGFASFAEWYLFRSSNSSSVKINEGSKMSFEEPYVTNNAKIGDIISLSGYCYNSDGTPRYNSDGSRKKAGHEVIFISANSYGITVLDSNWGNGCKVTKHTIGYYYCDDFQIGRATTRGEVAPPDTEGPTISGLNVKDISGDSFTVECNLNDNVGVTRVWYVLYAPGGTYEFGDSASNGYYSKKIETKNYGGAGKYSFHLYAFDAADNKVKEVYSEFNAYDEELPLNIGDDFYATILHTESWKPITRDEDGFIRLRSEKGSASQVWRFRRQDDGSYTIASTGDNKLLEMYCGITDNNNPVAVCNEDWGGAYQRWYIFKQGDGYVLQSKHYTSMNRVLTLQGFDTFDGMAVQTCVRTNLSTQIFSIYQGSDIQMKSPTLSSVTDGVMTTFSWNDIYGESGYDLLIYKDGNLYNSIRIISGNRCTHTQYLPIGNYTAYVQAFNAYEYKQSDTISISIAPLDIGTDFYATILHSDQWKPITYDSDSLVRIHDETTNSNQVWRFRRQEDGSYTIASVGDNKLLEMFCGITDNNNPVTVSSEDWGGAYQRWYIFRQGNGNRYIFLSKHCTSLGRVLTLNGTDLQTCDASNDSNKCFSIYSSSGIQLSNPILNVQQHNLKTTFSWSNVNCESGYDLLIYKENTLYRQVRILANEPRIYSEYLPEGNYFAHVQSFNAYEYKQSTDVTFNVSSKSTCSKSIVQKNNDKHTVKTMVYKDFSGQLIVAGYKNNCLVQIENKTYTEKTVITTLSGDIDEIKVMVWNNLSGLKPLCDVEVIPSSEWLTE